MTTKTFNQNDHHLIMRKITLLPDVLVMISLLTLSHFIFTDQLLAQVCSSNEEIADKWNSVRVSKILDHLCSDEGGKVTHPDRMIARQQLNKVGDNKRKASAVNEPEDRRRLTRKRSSRSDRWKKIVRQFDQDKDGKLSETELRNAREWAKNRTLEADKMKKRVVMKFDSNGDGEISKDEWRGIQSLVRDYQKKGREDLICKYDLDRDGKLSRKEKQLAQVAEKAEMLIKYDVSGDGELSNKERVKAFADMLENEPIRLLIQLRRQSLNYGSRATIPAK